MTKRSAVNILLVGDAGTGKTSLITSLVSGRFPAAVPSVLSQVRIAPEDTADELALFINDSASDEDFGQLQDQLKSADVVVVVYAVDMPETFERVKAFWLPQLTAAFSGPIIVAGNKSDLSESSDELEKRVRPILEGHPRVDACLEVSAKTNVRVADLFYFAQHAVVYPVYPLFETRTKTLTGPFRTALTRVFRHFDQDHDGMLSDVELNNFQEDCFGARLPADDLEGFKLVLQKEAVGYVTPQGVTLAGLQFLFKLFIQRNRPETSWLVLRKFGYDDKLELQLSDADLHIHAAPDQSVELSKKALDFLSRVFHQFDVDGDGTLSSGELGQVFSVCPGTSPRPWLASDSAERSLADMGDFPDGVLTNRQGDLTLAGWMGYWHMLTLLQPRNSLRFLRYLAFAGDAGQAYKVTRPRSLEKEENRLQRSVVRAFVFGAPKVGKSSLLNALVRKTASASSTSRAAGETKPRSAVAAVRPLDAALPSKTPALNSQLVLTEVPAVAAKSEQAFANELQDCDVAVMLFDVTDAKSVEFLEAVQRRIPSHVPCVYLGNKSDSGAARPALGPGAALAQSYSLAEPDAVSLQPPPAAQLNEEWQKNIDRLFQVLLATALLPKAARPMTEEQHALARRRRFVTALKRVSLLAGVLGGVVGLGVWWYRGGGSAKAPVGRAAKEDA